MSSANLVSVIYTPETVYGVTDVPLSGATAETVRMTSESLSGTPATTTSAEIRTDRMSAGQVVTGLDVGGAIDYELAPGQFWDDFFEASMMSTWVAAAGLSTDVTLTPDPLDDQQADLIITGDFSTIGPGVAVGDVLQLVPATGDPVPVTVISITTTTELVVATTRGQAAIVGVTMTVTIPSYLVIGTTQRSFTIGKSYLDVPTGVSTDVQSQTYTGSLVDTFNVSATYGSITTGNFGTMANGYLQETPSFEQQIVAAGGTVNPADVSSPINASIDVPIVTSDDVATNFCIESFTIDLANGLDPQTCIGSPAPKAYTLGTANVAITASIYLSNTSYQAYMPAKLTQAPVSMTFMMENVDGGYAFSMPAVQLSFPDPASGGQDEQTMIDAAGVAKVGANGESSLKIWKLVGVQ